MRTIDEVETDLTAVRTAMNEKRDGIQMGSFVVGTGDGQRRYTYNALTWGELQRMELKLASEKAEILAAASGEESMQFRGSCSVIMVTGSVM
jgi:hypothetical protein